MSFSAAIRGRLRKTRSVTVGTDMTVTITEVPGDYFRAQVYPARSSGGSNTDASPRANTPRSIVWYPARNLATPAVGLRAGDRVFDGSVEYEVLTNPIDRRAGLRTLVYEVEVAPVRSIYPLLAQLSDLGGVIVLPVLPLAIWEGSRSDASHDEYADLSAEAPAEFYNALRINNRELLVGSRPFRITQAILHTETPHVKMRLRSADA